MSKSAPPSLEYENSLLHKGYKLIAGVDEVGRGSLAGPVVAAACILNTNSIPEGIRDSKEITKQRREELDIILKKSCITYAISSVTAHIIDKIGILPATKLAMQKAIKKLVKQPDFILIDAVNINLPGTAQLSLIHGDQVSLSIAAASILAKVHRDKLMHKQAKKYPAYCFDKNVGYGTSEHVKAIKKFGHSPIHRRSFNF